MEAPLRILMLEDDPVDAEIIQWALQEIGACLFNVAINKEAYCEAHGTIPISAMRICPCWIRPWQLRIPAGLLEFHPYNIRHGQE